MGAHPPRVLFSAPSRKTSAASEFPKLLCPSHTQEAGREARPATPGAGVLPNFGVRVEPRHLGSYGTRGISTLPVASSRRCESSVFRLTRADCLGGFGTFAVTMRTPIPDALAILCLDCILIYS